jgi:hypothetical protein
MNNIPTENLHPVYVTKYLGEWKTHVYPATKDDAGFMAIYVPSSQSEKEPYTVIVEKDGSKRCDCRGFIYRESCRHCNLVTEYIKKRSSNTKPRA